MLVASGAVLSVHEPGGEVPVPGPPAPGASHFIVLLAYGPFGTLLWSFTGDDMFVSLRLATSAASYGLYTSNQLSEAAYWYELWWEYEVDILIREQQNRDLVGSLREHEPQGGTFFNEW